MFAGIGGFRLGLEPLGGRCVFASEIDRGAATTYRANWPVKAEPGRAVEGDTLVGDITALYAAQLPAFDVLTAGFPCQPFSDRGDQAGLADERGDFRTSLPLSLGPKPKPTRLDPTRSDPTSPNPTKADPTRPHPTPIPPNTLGLRSALP